MGRAITIAGYSALIVLVSATSGCFRTIHQEYFWFNTDLPVGSGKIVYLQRNPIDKPSKIVIVHAPSDYNIYPLGADDSNFVNQLTGQVKDTIGAVPIPIP